MTHTHPDDITLHTLARDKQFVASASDAESFPGTSLAATDIAGVLGGVSGHAQE